MQKFDQPKNNYCFLNTFLSIHFEGESEKDTSSYSALVTRSVSKTTT